MYFSISISQEWNFSINFLQLILTYLIKNSCSRMITMQFIPHTRHTSYIHSPFFSTKKKLFTNENAQQENLLPLDETRERNETWKEGGKERIGLSGK